MILFVAGAAQTMAATIDLDYWAFNIDNTITESPAFKSSNGQGLGTLEWSTTVAGDHFFLAYFDHEINESVNTNFNEFGSANNIGVLASGQSWEIDAPYWTDSSGGFGGGDVYANFTHNTLDKLIQNTDDGDVSMAMGWGFTLNEGEKATITLSLVDVLPEPFSSFYLEHYEPVDLNSKESVFFYGDLIITSSQIPEPGPLFLMGTGLLLFCGLTRKKENKLLG